MVRDSIPLFDHNVAIVWLMGELQPLHARNFLHFSNFSPISLREPIDPILLLIHYYIISTFVLLTPYNTSLAIFHPPNGPP